jgi:hypothetical protein
MLNKRGKQKRASGYVVACVLMGITGVLLLMSWASSAAAVLQPPGVEIGPNHTQQAHAGDTILYNHTLTNTGATTDTFTVEVLSTQGWPVELVGATQPTGTLSLQVASQMTAPVQIRLTVPMDAAGLTDNTIVTATSQLSPTVQGCATDTTIVVPYRIIFPLVTKRWPPVPYPATLNPIDNTDGNGFYTISWSVANLADTYALEEDDNAGFSSPTTVYEGTGTSWSVPSPGRSSGTYYYRVRGRNQWGYGDYSNVQAVTVLRFRVEHTNLNAGQCTTLAWEFTNIKKLHIIFGYGYDKEPVDGQGSRQVCPSLTTTYKATVTKQDNSEETHQVKVYVSGDGCGDPIVWYFEPNTYTVGVGAKVSVFWHVECAKGVWLQIGSAAEQGVVGHSYKADIVLWGTTTFKLRIKKANGDNVYASFTVEVK